MDHTALIGVLLLIVAVIWVLHGGVVVLVIVVGLRGGLDLLHFCFESGPPLHCSGRGASELAGKYVLVRLWAQYV